MIGAGNTERAARGLAMSILDSERRLAGVRYGMRVLDSTGAPVGFVCAVKHADHLAIDAYGRRIGQSTDLIALLPHLKAVEPKVGSMRDAARLVRLGYVKIDGRGVDHVNRYALAEDIQSVDDLIRLSVPRHELPTQTT
jgi:hypothetical protein